MNKKLLIIIGILLIVIGIIILIFVFKDDKEDNDKIEVDKDIVLKNLKEEGYQEAEDNIYVLTSNNNGIISTYIFNFNESKFQFYYKNDEFNAISEYNYLYNKSSYTFIRKDDRGTINYDHNNKKIDCDSNILNWCEDNKKDFKEKYSIYDEFVKLTK